MEKFLDLISNYNNEYDLSKHKLQSTHKHDKKCIICGSCYYGISDSTKQWKLSESEYIELVSENNKSKNNTHNWVRMASSEIKQCCDNNLLYGVKLIAEHDNKNSYGYGIVGTVTRTWADEKNPLCMKFEARVYPDQKHLINQMDKVSLRFTRHPVSNKINFTDL